MTRAPVGEEGTKGSGRQHNRGGFLQVLLAMPVLVSCCKAGSPSPEAPAPEVVAAAGDIASCGGEGDEATTTPLATIEGTVITLGDSALERAPMPSSESATHLPLGAEGYFAYFGSARRVHKAKAITPTIRARGTYWRSTAPASR